MPPESDKWGWKHVTVFGVFDKGSGTKRWKCNHCNLRYNGSYSRVRAHLLGFSGVGVKSCPAIDGSVREAFQVFEEERLARRTKRVPRADKHGKRIRTAKLGGVAVSKEEVDGSVARFFYVNSLNLNVVNSPHFREMTKAIASYGHRYESPAVVDLSGSFLSKEKARIEKSMAPIYESWLHTGCSVLCVGRSDSRLGFFHIDIFVSCPRGLVFLHAVDIADDNVDETHFSDVLVGVIIAIGSENVLQIVSHFDRANQVSESLALPSFPHIFMSLCTSHSLCMLMEEIAEIGWIKAVLTSAKRIEPCLTDFREFSPVTFSSIITESSNQTASKFAPFFEIVQQLLQLKQPLKDAVTSHEWKLDTTRDTAKAEIAICSFWDEAECFVQLLEPFVRLLGALHIDGFFMGDICNWRVQAFEELRSKGPIGVRLNLLEELFANRWDALFSPLHAAGYILNPRYFGKGQAKDKIVMKGWKATLERYERESTARRILREQLSSYWRLEGSLGDEDAVHCRDKMDPVAWWENFGSETPLLQTLAIKVLSQVSSVAACKGICRDDRMTCGEAAGRSGVERVEDLVFVQNNLRIHIQKNGTT